MGMLERIKKKQEAGFKEFVINMETTGAQSRGQIFTAGVLEDPVYMGWVMKNIRTFDDFLQLPSDEIDLVLSNQDQMMPVLAKCIFGLPEEKIIELESIIPRYMGRLKDELSYLKDVTPSEKESAKFFIMKTARKLQTEDRIPGFPWKMPPHEIFFPKSNKDGPGKIFFENGTLAAEGTFLKNRRIGPWRHNYDTGLILAEGEYLEGLKTGVWVFYYSNGNLKAQGKYKMDLRNGLWKEWDRNGQMTEVEYVDGVKK
jgi:hypothetical protein